MGILRPHWVSRAAGHSAVDGDCGSPWARDRELHFIVAVVHSQITGRTDPAVVQALELGIDWQRLVTIAMQQRLLPLLANASAGVCNAVFPADLGAALQTYVKNLREDNLRKLNALADALAILKADSIAALTFKGLTLAQLASGDGFARDINDLDVLVAPAAFAEAVRALTEQGYGIDPRHATDAEVHLFCPQGAQDLVLDMHCGFAGPQFPAPTDMTGLFERATTQRIGRHDLPTLDPADHLIVLSINLIKQFILNDPSLRYLADIAALEHTGSAATVGPALERAHELNLHAAVILALANATTLFGDPDVGNSMTAADRVGAKSRLFVLDDRFVRACAVPSRSPFPIWRWPYLWHAHQGFRDKIVCALGRQLAYMTKVAVKVTDNDFAFVKLPPSCRMLYPLIRPFRLLWVALGRMRARP